MDQGDYIEVGGQKFLRSRVTARLKLADPKSIPLAVAKASSEVEKQFY